MMSASNTMVCTTSGWRSRMTLSQPPDRHEPASAGRDVDQWDPGRFELLLGATAVEEVGHFDLDPVLREQWSHGGHRQLGAAPAGAVHDGQHFDWSIIAAAISVVLKSAPQRSATPDHANAVMVSFSSLSPNRTARSIAAARSVAGASMSSISPSIPVSYIDRTAPTSVAIAGIPHIAGLEHDAGHALGAARRSGRRSPSRHADVVEHAGEGDTVAERSSRMVLDDRLAPDRRRRPGDGRRPTERRRRSPDRRASRPRSSRCIPRPRIGRQPEEAIEPPCARRRRPPEVIGRPCVRNDRDPAASNRRAVGRYRGSGPQRDHVIRSSQHRAGAPALYPTSNPGGGIADAAVHERHASPDQAERAGRECRGPYATTTSKSHARRRRACEGRGRRALEPSVGRSRRRAPDRRTPGRRLRGQADGPTRAPARILRSPPRGGRRRHHDEHPHRRAVSSPSEQLDVAHGAAPVGERRHRCARDRSPRQDRPAARRGARTQRRRSRARRDGVR